MPEDQVAIIRSDIAALSCVLEEHMTEERASMAQLHRIVRGDSERPHGLVQQTADIEARVTVHDRRAWAIKWLGSPLLAALVSVVVWGAAQVWAHYVERSATVASNREQIAVLKERVDHIGEAIEQNQREIMEALTER